MCVQELIKSRSYYQIFFKIKPHALKGPFILTVQSPPASDVFTSLVWDKILTRRDEPFTDLRNMEIQLISAAPGCEHDAGPLEHIVPVGSEFWRVRI